MFFFLPHLKQNTLRDLTIPEKNFTVQRGERGIILNDSDPLLWLVRFTRSDGSNVEVNLPTNVLFRVTKELTQNGSMPP